MALELSVYRSQQVVIVHRQGCKAISTHKRTLVVEPIVRVVEGWGVSRCFKCKPVFGTVVRETRRVRSWPRELPGYFDYPDERRGKAVRPWPPAGVQYVDISPGGSRDRTWRMRANCRSADHRLQDWLRWLWTHNHLKHWPVTVMKVLCTECPVRRECLEAGVWGEEAWGVWGGATVEERAKLRRKWVLEGRVERRAGRKDGGRDTAAG